MNTNKKMVVAAVAAFTGMGALAIGGLTTLPAKAQGPVIGVPSQGPNGQNRQRGERHPELRRALRNLMQAQNNLQHAAHDYDGHREQALDLTQKAIEQVKLALASDRK